MSTDHHERIARIVDRALKEAALGEPYGFTVSGPSAWPQYAQTPDGKQAMAGLAPAWFVLVTIRAGLGEPDIGNGFPIPGVLPEDELFRQVATGLLEKCRQERDAVNGQAMKQLGMDLTKALEAK